MASAPGAAAKTQAALAGLRDVRHLERERAKLALDLVLKSAGLAPCPEVKCTICSHGRRTAACLRMMFSQRHSCCHGQPLWCLFFALDVSGRPMCWEHCRAAIVGRSARAWRSGTVVPPSCNRLQMWGVRACMPHACLCVLSCRQRALVCMCGAFRHACCMRACVYCRAAIMHSRACMGRLGMHAVAAHAGRLVFANLWDGDAGRQA
eukprot:349810-Chlamydomonas_euryale.AAC.5